MTHLARSPIRRSAFGILLTALIGLLVSASLSGQPIKAELAPSVTVDPKEISFNFDQPQSTVELSILLHADVKGKLSYRIEAPAGIQVLPSAQGGIQVGQPLKLKFRLIDHNITHSLIQIVVSGPGGVTFQQSVKVTVFKAMAMKLPPKPAPPPPPPQPAPAPIPATAAAAHAPAAAAAAPAPAAASAPVHHKKEKKSPPPSATSAAPPTAKEFKAYWNTWSTDWQDKLTDKFDPPASETEDAATSQTRLYHFYADLSGIDFSPVKKLSTHEASSELKGLLSLPTLNTVTLQILTTVEGDGIALASKTGWRKVRVDIGQLRRDDLAQWQTEIRELPTEEKFFEIVKATSALRNPQGKDWRPIKVDVRATKPGCAAVALSIWNEDLTQPLDQIAWPVSVGGEPCSLRADFDRTLTGALLDRFGASLSQRPSAALHIFEFDLNKRTNPIAVFALRGQKSPLHWTLKVALTGIVSNRLQPAADKARNKNDSYGYAEVSGVLEEVLFQGPEGSKALSEIKQLAQSEGRPLIYARIVSEEGLSIALPLALLDVGNGPLGRHARVLSPLRHERVSNQKGCVAKWAVLTNGDVGSLPEQMKPGYPDWPNAKAYLRSACADVSKQPSEAVFLLAHHPTDGSEAIGYDSGGDTLTVSGLTRCYPPGSIGLFFLCQFANPTPSRVPLTCLEAFNENGLDAAIASTFSLDDTFAKHFLAALERTVSELPRATTFGDLFDETVARLGKDFGQKDADEAFELSLIGNPDLKICGSGNE
jgi:hypothetical protein